MKKTILILTALSLLAGCMSDAEKASNREWKMSGKAKFYSEAEYNGCQVGSLHWINDNNYEQSITAVVCNGKPSESVEYPSGKTHTGNVVMGEPKSDEQIRLEQEAAKQAALSKLTEDERKLLGVK